MVESKSIERVGQSSMKDENVETFLIERADKPFDEEGFFEIKKSTAL